MSFRDVSSREAFYEKRKNIAPDKDPKKNIYVNDRITNYRKGLFYSARKLCKSKRVFAAWTQKGNVLVRKFDSGPILEIRKHSDLMSIRDNYERDEDLTLTSSRDSNEEVISHLSDYDFSDFDY